MLSTISLTTVLCIAFVQCNLNIELNDGGEVSIFKNQDDQLDELTTGENCGVTNRLTFPIYFDLEHGFKSFRSSLNSSAMYNIKWSNKLANYAQEKADKCDLGFKFSKNCDAFYYTSINSYTYGNNVEIDISGLLESMYKEKEQYDINNNKCKTYGACTFFRYISRDTLSEFGCAATKCPSLKFRDDSVVHDAVRTVCYISYGAKLHHVPANRYVPYSNSGEVCSKCKDLIKGGYSCVNGLCEDKCTPGTCVCNIEKNCPYGFFNKDTCECECKKGKFGDKCQLPCKCVDTIPDCSEFKTYCYNGRYTPYVRQYCSASCPNVCEILKPKAGLKSCEE